jgi:hypothetical protein
MVKVIPFPQFSRSDLLRLGDSAAPTAVCCTPQLVVVALKSAICAFSSEQSCSAWLTTADRYSIVEMICVDELDAILTIEHIEKVRSFSLNCFKPFDSNRFLKQT